MGRLVREKTYFVVPYDSDLHLPSDLLGLVAGRYDANRSDGNWRAAVSPACDDIRQALEKAAVQSQSDQLRKPDPLGEGLAWLQEYVNKAFKMFLTQKNLPTLDTCEIRSSDEGYHTKLGRADVTVRFGRIELCRATEPSCVVALPANEFFDDECVNDTHSALGAYVQAAFPGKVHELQRLIAEKLAHERPILVEREPKTMAKSYGIAKCVYVNNPLASNRRIIFVSVTTKRAGVGLRSEARYLFAAMKAICREMNDQRLRDLHVPLMGSGHGGLECELALLYLLLSLKAVLNDSSTGAHLRSVNIVVFQNDDCSPPSVSREAAGRILCVAKASS